MAVTAEWFWLLQDASVGADVFLVGLELGSCAIGGSACVRHDSGFTLHHFELMLGPGVLSVS